MNDSEFLNTINHFYYGASLRELQLMNGESCLPGLSYNSLLYLDVISQVPDCTVSHLAGLLHISKPAATMKVNELVRQGFLVKTQSTADKRVFYISLSRDTAEIYSLYDTIFRHIGKKMREKYSEKELDLFCDIIHSITECDWDGVN